MNTTQEQQDILAVIERLGLASELNINKNCEYTYLCIHNTLRILKRNRVIDTNDDGDYFVVKQ